MPKLLRCYRCQQWPCECQDGCTIINGDCSEVLEHIVPSTTRLLLTDPPYGIGYDRQAAAKSGSRHGKAAAPKATYRASGWDDQPASDELLYRLLAVCGPAVIWGGNHFGLPRSRGWLFWDKDNGANQFSDGELAWTSFDMPLRRKKHTWNGMLQEHKGQHKEQRWHPTQKPLSIMRWCLEIALKQDPTIESVLDPFMGSGTTLVAARDFGLRCIGIELDPLYCQVACDRLAQKTLF